MSNQTPKGRLAILLAVITVQALCAVFFAFDVISDYALSNQTGLSEFDLVVEAIAAVVLIVAIWLELRQLLDMYRANERYARSLRVASGAMDDLIQDYFRTWSLTPAEADVAIFTIKGSSIAEIAAMCGSAEGTVKTQLNAIYRKAGVSGRGQLVSLLIEDLMGGPLVDPADKGA